MSTEALISRSVNVDDYVNPVVYEESHTLPYGYWICTVCKSRFYGGGDTMHNENCSLNERVKHIYAHPKLIYLLGPNDNGRCLDVDIKQLEQIKKLAKGQNIIKKDNLSKTLYSVDTSKLLSKI